MDEISIFQVDSYLITIFHIISYRETGLPSIIPVMFPALSTAKRLVPLATSLLRTDLASRSAYLITVAQLDLDWKFIHT